MSDSEMDDVLSIKARATLFIRFTAHFQHVRNNCFLHLILQTFQKKL